MRLTSFLRKFCKVDTILWLTCSSTEYVSSPSSYRTNQRLCHLCKTQTATNLNQTVEAELQPMKRFPRIASSASFNICSKIMYASKADQQKQVNTTVTRPRGEGKNAWWLSETVALNCKIKLYIVVLLSVGCFSLRLALTRPTCVDMRSRWRLHELMALWSSDITSSPESLTPVVVRVNLIWWTIIENVPHSSFWPVIKCWSCA